MNFFKNARTLNMLCVFFSLSLLNGAEVEALLKSDISDCSCAHSPIMKGSYSIKDHTIEFEGDHLKIIRKYKKDGETETKIYSSRALDAEIQKNLVSVTCCMNHIAVHSMGQTHHQSSVIHTLIQESKTTVTDCLDNLPRPVKYMLGSWPVRLCSWPARLVIRQIF